MGTVAELITQAENDPAKRAAFHALIADHRLCPHRLVGGIVLPCSCWKPL